MLKKILIVPILFLCFQLNAESLKEPLAGLTAVKNTKPETLTRDGKKMVLFWGSWCPDCKEKMAGELLEINKRPNIDVLTVNMDNSPSRALHTVEKNNIQLPVYRDEQRNLIKQLQVFSVPHWAIYEKSGENWKLVKTQAAYNSEEVEKWLK